MSTVTIVNGSLSQSSSTSIVCEALCQALSARNAAVNRIDLTPTHPPLFQPESRHDVTPMREQILASDAVVLATPDYHGSPSGAMKNFLDYFWRDWTGRLVGYICLSHEKGLTAMDMLRVAIRQCYGWSMPYGISANESVDIDKTNGVVKNQKCLSRIEMYAYDLITYGSLLSAQRRQDMSSSEPSFTAILR